MDRFRRVGAETERISRVNRVEELRLNQSPSATAMVKTRKPMMMGLVSKEKEEGTEYTVHWECRGQVEGPG